MIFLAPAVLIGLLALPVLYFLLRLTPPSPQKIAFPPLAFLRDLKREERTPQTMPLWLLLLRLAASALIIIGLAGPTLHPPPALPGAGPVLVVIDNGWAAAADWQARLDAAENIVSAARQSGRGVAILATARTATSQAPHLAGVFTADRALQILTALQPEPWPVDRAGAAAALAAAPAFGAKIYLADGLTDGPDFPAFIKTLQPSQIYSAGIAAALLEPAGLAPNGDLLVHLAAGPPAANILAETAAGNVLASAAIGPDGIGRVHLPLALASRVEKLVLAAPPQAGATLLLDGAAHGALVGLDAGTQNAETPFLGPLFFARLALPPGSQPLAGSLATLIAAKAAVIILADVPLSNADQQAAETYVENGGELIRFAGPLTAQDPDPLNPDPLLVGDRRLGGALTWTAPESMAPFAETSPFAGLPLDSGAKISRQMLADPTQLDPATVWAQLSDGTPVVIGRTLGRGILVTCLTTANADWSSLSLSGLFPPMLARLIALSHGAPVKPSAVLPLTAALDAFGTLAPPATPARLTASALQNLIVSPTSPPGIYGAGGLALNLAQHIPPLIPAPLPGATPFTGQRPPEDVGPPLIAAALLLLSLDLLLSLGLRGLLRAAALLLLLVAPHAGHAQNAGQNAVQVQIQPPPPTQPSAQSPALATTLAYVISGDAATDQISADGLSYLSALVTTHSSARLQNPAAVTPGIDDLALYPLLYWPVLPTAAAPSPAACAALTSYMQHGGLLVIDSAGGDAFAPGSGAGFSPGTSAAIARVTACLGLPPLEPLTPGNVLAHCFYIVDNFPGRFTGAPILIAPPPARDADGVTPIIIAQNDFAAAWARDPNGNPEQTPIPGGDDQRTIAERFGTNLVIYALTGSYKADQANLPALLDRLGP